MTQDRRITDRHPDQPLQWDDQAIASPSQSVPSELAKRLRNQAAMPFGPEGFALLTEAADELDRLAAPVAADTEQARDAARYRWLRRDDTDVGNVIDKEFKPGYWEYKSGAELDAAIDAAMGIAHLATPADAGAGLNLTDERIQSFFNEREFFPEELMDPKRFYNSVREIARLSTPGAQVTAEPVATDHDHDEAVTLLAAVFDAWENGTECYAEPETCASYLGVAFKLDGEIFNRCCDLLNRVNPPRNTTTAPADRDAIRDQALEEVMTEILRLINDAETDPSREAPILLDFVRAKLKSMERAADAAGTRDAEGGEQ